MEASGPRLDLVASVLVLTAVEVLRGQSGLEVSKRLLLGELQWKEVSVS